MPHPLYSVLAFTCFIVLLIFRNQFKLVLDESEQTDKDFLFLSNWVTLFCLQDVNGFSCGNGNIGLHLAQLHFEFHPHGT